MKRSSRIHSGLNWAWIGLVFGILALGFVVVSRIIAPGAQGRLTSISIWTLAFLYLVVAPGVGFMGGLARSWMPGRLGSLAIATALGAATMAIILPILPSTRTPWGPIEYTSIVGMALLSGIMLGARHR